MTQVRVATREILIDGVNALLYKDKKGLIEKIILLAKDRNLREELGRNARETCDERAYMGEEEER